MLLTERLQLRPYRPDEAHLLQSIIGDQRIVFWREEPGTMKEAEQWLEKNSSHPCGNWDGGLGGV